MMQNILCYFYFELALRTVSFLMPKSPIVFERSAFVIVTPFDNCNLKLLGEMLYALAIESINLSNVLIDLTNKVIAGELVNWLDVIDIFNRGGIKIS